MEWPGELALREEERVVIDAIRGEEISSVVVEMKNGEIRALRMTGSTDTSKLDPNEVLRMLMDGDYHAVTAKKQDGKVVRLDRTKIWRLTPDEAKKSSRGAGQPSRKL